MACAECRSQQFEIMKSERPHTFGCRNKYGVVGDVEYRFMCILSSAKQSNFMGISLKWQRRKTLRNFCGARDGKWKATVP